MAGHDQDFITIASAQSVAREFKVQVLAIAARISPGLRLQNSDWGLKYNIFVIISHTQGFYCGHKKIYHHLMYGP